MIVNAILCTTAALSRNNNVEKPEHTLHDLVQLVPVLLQDADCPGVVGPVLEVGALDVSPVEEQDLAHPLIARTLVQGLGDRLVHLGVGLNQLAQVPHQVAVLGIGKAAPGKKERAGKFELQI